jgi:hypothetical protein
MNKIRYCLPLFFTLLLWVNAPSQDALNRSVQVSVKVQESPPRFDFSWEWDWSEGGYLVFKKTPGDPSWGTPVDSLPWGSTAWSDVAVQPAVAYEYAFFKKKFEKIYRHIPVPAGATVSFTIQNVYGDGLCCNFGHGWYLLQACGETLAGGSDFGFEKTDVIQICDKGNPVETLTVAINPDMLTNNTRWTLKDANGITLDSSGPPGSLLAERPKYGYIQAGFHLPPTENRGSILLLVDDSYSQPLSVEIAQLEKDFIADGWRVLRRDVSRNQAVASVKQLIINAFSQTPDLKMLYLLGHIPVPYAGSLYPDGHSENHWGAWPADVFYGELDGVWTDATVSNTTALFPRNHNLPGDGKFDQSDIPGAVELAIGRVDLFDMPAFGLSDVELTRRYLAKARAFKTGRLPVVRRALVDDNLGIVLGAPAASGWRNFAPMFTADSVQALDYFSTMKNRGYLWSFGGGSGTHTSANGIGSTADFAQDTLKNIFTMLCGSQFGDWDNPDNFLRAPLASPGWTLTSCWVGNPPFTFHRMALGEPIGFSLLRTQNATENDYYPGPQRVHTALMGDPTLRLHPVKPPQSVSVVQEAGQRKVQWSPPAGEPVAGYHVYRADSLYGAFLRLNAGLVTTTSFTDETPAAGSAVYMVRAAKRELSGSGIYWNLSLGEMASAGSDPCAGAPFETEVFAEICRGQSYQFHDSTYTESGIYEHLFTTASGCDSVVVLFLSVTKPPILSLSLTLCEGENIAFGDTVLTTAGNHHIFYYDSLGCLHEAYISLSLGKPDSVFIDTLILSTEPYMGVFYDHDTTLVFTYLNALGCDSVVTVSLDVTLVTTGESLREAPFSLYPNPADGVVFLEFFDPQSARQIEVTDGCGRRVFTSKGIHNQRVSIDLGGLPHGAYFVRVIRVDGVWVKKIVRL